MTKKSSFFLLLLATVAIASCDSSQSDSSVPPLPEGYSYVEESVKFPSHDDCISHTKTLRQTQSGVATFNEHAVNEEMFATTINLKDGTTLIGVCTNFNNKSMFSLAKSDK